MMVALAAVFFFQAEDGIRDVAVTGVQTCALPIFVAFRRSASEHPEVSSRRGAVVSENGRTPNDGTIEVQAMTLDAIAENHPLPTMVKIDVEGAEVEVLRGAQRMISQTKPVLLFEVHHRQAATLLEDQLQQKDYRIDWLPPHPGFTFPRHLLALPSECSDR